MHEKIQTNIQTRKTGTKPTDMYIYIKVKTVTQSLDRKIACLCKVRASKQRGKEENKPHRAVKQKYKHTYLHRSRTDGGGKESFAIVTCKRKLIQKHQLVVA